MQRSPALYAGRDHWPSVRSPGAHGDDLHSRAARHSNCPRARYQYIRRPGLGFCRQAGDERVYGRFDARGRPAGLISAGCSIDGKVWVQAPWRNVDRPSVGGDPIGPRESLTSSIPVGRGPHGNSASSTVRG